MSEDKQIQTMMDMVDNYLICRGSVPRVRKKFNYYPSGIGKCLRKQQYERLVHMGVLKARTEEVTGQQQRRFDIGNEMHERWAKYFEDIGILRGYWKCSNKLCKAFDDDGNFRKDLSQEDLSKMASKNEKEMDTRIYGKENEIGVFKPNKCSCGCNSFIYEETVAEMPELNYRGRMDLVLDFSNFDDYFKNDLTKKLNLNVLPKKDEIIIIDMKTCNENSYVRQVEKQGGHPEYIAQIISYIHIIEQAKYGLLVYENKNNSKMKWVKVPKNERWWNTLKWQLEILNKGIDPNDGAKSKLPPPKPKDKYSFGCKYCQFKDICHTSAIWKDPKLESKRKSFYRDLLFD